MSPESVELVRASWRVLAPRSDSLSAAFHARLFELAPELRALFGHVDLVVQREKFMEMLATLVGVLDDPGMLVSESVPCGRRHAGYGAAAAHYELVGAALLSTLGESLGDAWTNDTRDAWRELYALVAAVMQRAGAHGPMRTAAH